MLAVNHHVDGEVRIRRDIARCFTYTVSATGRMPSFRRGQNPGAERQVHARRCARLVVRVCEGEVMHVRRGVSVRQAHLGRAGCVWRSVELQVAIQSIQSSFEAMDQVSPQLRDFIQVGVRRSLAPVHRLRRSPSPADTRCGCRRSWELLW
jgi:hypothetical protein